MEKSELRRKIKAMKSLMLDMEKVEAADAVFRQLEQTAAFIMSENILMYHSLPDELSTHSFLRKWAGKKHFFLPRVNGVNLEILPYEESRLELGAFHIEEPSGQDTIDVEHIEMIVVPAIAYDRRGNRLGRGKGFYDRLLGDSKAIKVGVGYEFQLVDEVPVEAHDVSMDMVISPSGCIVIKKR
ncbi:MAG: 5-formyltetrahydrofolate cyclo-ligase [Muribaculaceae bacterium]|nr:5-formyltetrahydrofolate cyclo-ligase [Muribaculaceae bacterium]